MVTPVVADADTLFGATTRGFLIFLDYHGVIRLHWSSLILEEMSRALMTTGRKPDLAAALANEDLMRRSLPNAEVSVDLVQAQFRVVAFGMRSIKDTHVAACAHALLAQRYYLDTEVVSLVTKNIKDFSIRKLATIGIAVQRPDPFLLTLFRQQPQKVGAAFEAFRRSLRSKPTVSLLLEKLGDDGQVVVAEAMRQIINT